MKKALSLSILLFFAFALHAANLYVSTLGNDAADGLSWSNAKECVQAAISAAQSGDTVFVAAGLYAQRIVMSNGVHVFGGYDATTGKRDILANMTILDGTSLQNRLVDASAHFSMVTYVDGLVLQNANHSVRGGAAELSRNVVMNQCTIRQCVTNKGGGGVYNNGGRVVNCVIELCEALDAGGGVHNYGGVVENCIIRGCKGKYGAIRNEMNGVVRNCLVHNNEPSTTAWPNSGGIYNPSGVVYNNTLACNYGSQYAGFHSDNIAYNNLMWNNQSEEGFADPANFVSGEKTKNGSGHNAADFYFDAENFTVYLGVDNMASDGPHFVAPTLYVGAPKNDAEIAAMRAANFSLMAGSPVIDRAKMGLDLAYDIDNNPRPVNGRADIGCYEYDPDAPIVPVISVRISSDTIVIYLSDTVWMTPIIIPSKATNHNVQWAVGDAILKLDRNAICAQAEGATWISVTTEDGAFTDTAVVVVVPKPVIVVHKDVLEADSLYAIHDYTIPSYIPFWVAKEAARRDSTEANLQALKDKISLLRPYQEPYNVVANINGDPRTQMAFAWFTNDRMTEGVVQLMPYEGELEEFVPTITVEAVPTVTKPLNYATSLSGILKATKMSVKQTYTYVSHKAIVEHLTPNTRYAYRVGVEGYWSEVATFTTAPDKNQPFTFLYMTDSHIMNQEYVDAAQLCAEAAAKYATDAQFCVFPGDFVETGTNRNSEWEWERWFEESFRNVTAKMPIVPTDGNHDDSPNMNYSYHFNTDNQFKQNATIKPQFDGTTYSFMYGDVLFLVYSLQDFWKGAYSYTSLTSTYLTHDVGNWFREQVAAHPEAKWRVALVHKNIFSGSGHQEDEETPLFRAAMLPIMKECEIDLMLQGHDHCYEIIGPVDSDTRKPILSAISGVETVPVDSVQNILGKKGGTFVTNKGTLYFIGSTCGEKRYNPNSRSTMEADYDKHLVENYFDLFTGMFGQPGCPSYSTFTVDGNTITVHSYKVCEGEEPELFNTFYIKRTKKHRVPSQYLTLNELTEQDVAVKWVYNDQMYIMRDNVAYDVMGQVVALQ